MRLRSDFIATWDTAVNKTGQLALLLCKAKTIGALVSLCPVKGTFDKLFSEVMSARILFTCSFSMLSLCFANCQIKYGGDAPCGS